MKRLILAAALATTLASGCQTPCHNKLASAAQTHVNMISLDDGKPTFACAVAVSKVLKDTGYSINGSDWVNVLVAELKAKGWRSVSPGTPGGVLYTLTTSQHHGHIGIVDDNGLIYNNDSKDGRWIPTLTVESWQAYWKGPVEELMPPTED